MMTEDADAVADLSGQFVYLLTPTRMRKRNAGIIGEPDNGL